MKLKVVLCVLLLLLQPVITFADLNITVEPNKGWGNAPTSNIKRLCENVALHFQEQLRDEHKVKGKLTIVYNADGPIAFYRSFFGGGPDEYKVGLTVTDTYWNQFSYQFGHEFCHIMENHDTISKNNPNRWFHESICMMASIWVLKQMSETWAYRPPYPNWVSYRHNLLRYADNSMQRPGVQFSGTAEEWLDEWEQFLRDDYRNSFTHHLTVLQLSQQFLPIFEENPEAWNAVRQMPASTSRMSQYIQDWYEAVDPEDKIFVEAIAEIMSIEVIPAIASKTDTFDEYTNLTFTYENDESIIPVNSPYEWDGWTQGVWEKYPNGTISQKPGGYLGFDEMGTLSNWIYSHASSKISYDISHRNHTSFSAYFMIPNPGCHGGASMKFIASADDIEIYTKSLYLSDYGAYIEFDIPVDTRDFSISIDELGNNGCDHYVLGEPRLYYDNAKSIQSNINADVNKDGYVDLYDVMIVRSGMQNSVSYDTDINNDGKTDEVDLLIVKAKAFEAIAAVSPSKRKIKLTTWGSMKSR